MIKVKGRRDEFSQEKAAKRVEENVQGLPRENEKMERILIKKMI